MKPTHQVALVAVLMALGQIEGNAKSTPPPPEDAAIADAQTIPPRLQPIMACIGDDMRHSEFLANLRTALPNFEGAKGMEAAIAAATRSVHGAYCGETWNALEAAIRQQQQTKGADFANAYAAAYRRTLEWHLTVRWANSLRQEKILIIN